MSDSDDAEAVVRAIDEIGIDRLTETIVTAWEGIGGGVEPGPTWPRTRPHSGSSYPTRTNRSGWTCSRPCWTRHHEHRQKHSSISGWGDGTTPVRNGSLSRRLRATPLFRQRTPTRPEQCRSRQKRSMRWHKSRGDTGVRGHLRRRRTRDSRTGLDDARFSLPASAVETVQEAVGAVDAERFERA